MWPWQSIFYPQGIRKGEEEEGMRSVGGERGEGGGGGEREKRNT